MPGSAAIAIPTAILLFGGAQLLENGPAVFQEFQFYELLSDFLASGRFQTRLDFMVVSAGWCPRVIEMACFPGFS